MFRGQVYRKVGEKVTEANSAKATTRKTISDGQAYFNALMSLPYVEMTAEQVAHRCVLFDWFSPASTMNQWTKQDIQALASILDSREG